MSDPTPPNPPATRSAAGPSPWLRLVLPTVGVSVIGAAALFAGHLIGAGAFEGDARDPLEVVREMAPAGVTCTQVVRVDEAGGERAAVCLTTGNEVLTIGTFTERPDPDAWATELCAASVDGVVPVQGALVVFDNALVTVVAGPLSSEGGARVPDPEALADAVATSLDGEWQRYEC